MPVSRPFFRPVMICVRGVNRDTLDNRDHLSANSRSDLATAMSPDQYGGRAKSGPARTTVNDLRGYSLPGCDVPGSR